MAVNMTQQLLNCTICPKLPVFSDTSHLLTHVSSKGHLSHLHKLQVKSHQELAAGIQLAAYNQWYQDHGLGQLLSERMLLKEAKQATKKANAAKRGATINQQEILPPISQTLASSARPGTRRSVKGQRKAVRARRSRKDEDSESDLDFSPTKRSKRKHRRSKTISPIKRVLASDPPLSSEADCPAEIDTQCLATPEHAKLKGTIWPGMDLFDAATSEMRKKRNQKKDGSVLRKMERLAGMVQPTEAVYSPGGELRKERHIDDLEDASSLIEGETPIPKSKPVRPRTRQPLADRDTNAPRLVKRRAKAGSCNNPADASLAELPLLPYSPSSSTFDSYILGGPLNLSDNDEKDFKRRIPTFPNCRRPPTFTIFNDGGPDHSPTATSLRQRNPLSVEQKPVIGNTCPQLSMITAPWLQPQHQSPLQYPNPYDSYHPVHRQYPGISIAETDKENNMPLDGLIAAPGIYNANPLSWKSPPRELHAMPVASDSPFDNFFGLLSGINHSEDPFVATKNPLAEALSHFETEQDGVVIKQDSDYSTETVSHVAVH